MINTNILFNFPVDESVSYIYIINMSCQILIACGHGDGWLYLQSE